MTFGAPQTASGYKPKGNMSGDKIPSGYQKGQLQQFTPEQMELFQSLFGHLLPEGFLSQLAGGDEAAFEQVEAPQKRQFGEALGGIASKFSGMGMGGQKSSGFQNTLTSAASNFAQELGGKRQEMQSNALKDLFGLSNMLMGQKPTDKFLTEKPKSFLEELMMSLSGGAGKAFGSYMGGGF